MSIAGTYNKIFHTSALILGGMPTWTASFLICWTTYGLYCWRSEFRSCSKMISFDMLKWNSPFATVDFLLVVLLNVRNNALWVLLAKCDGTYRQDTFWDVKGLCELSLELLHWIECTNSTVVTDDLTSRHQVLSSQRAVDNGETFLAILTRFLHNAYNYDDERCLVCEFAERVDFSNLL